MISLVAALLLMTACTGSVDPELSSTPDPLLMDFYDRTIWEFENLRNRVSDLAANAADTPVDELEPIIQEMIALKEEIKGYEFPLPAAQTHSTLYNYAFYTEQCYFSKYAEFLMASSSQGTMRKPEDDPCDQVQVYRETLNQYLQDLKELEADS